MKRFVSSAQTLLGRLIRLAWIALPLSCIDFLLCSPEVLGGEFARTVRRFVALLEDFFLPSLPRSQEAPFRWLIHDGLEWWLGLPVSRLLAEITPFHVLALLIALSILRRLCVRLGKLTIPAGANSVRIPMKSGLLPSLAREADRRLACLQAQCGPPAAVRDMGIRVQRLDKTAPSDAVIPWDGTGRILLRGIQENAVSEFLLKEGKAYLLCADARGDRVQFPLTRGIPLLVVRTTPQGEEKTAVTWLGGC